MREAVPAGSTPRTGAADLLLGVQSPGLPPAPNRPGELFCAQAPPPPALPTIFEPSL